VDKVQSGDKFYARKMFEAEYVAEEKRAKMLTELQALECLQHPCISQVHDFSTETDEDDEVIHNLTTEWAESGSL
jgi:hypothetical protein